MRKTRVVFLDRDGVINRFPGRKKYVTSLKRFKLLAGSREAVALLTARGYRLFVISNQAGVAKGLYSRRELGRMTRYMLGEVRKAGGRIRRVLYCLHPSDAGCACRKPRTGNLKTATRGLRLDKKNSYFIGDSVMDVKAGKAFGVKTVMVLTGREKAADASGWEAQPDFVAPNLWAAARNIVAGRYDRA
ncbi:MAG: D-glycero-alpha-D-manno-heptose-1,7-bisphosphate 7-phosphatase [Deltaproteobacteria bacterium]